MCGLNGLWDEILEVTVHLQAWQKHVIGRSSMNHTARQKDTLKKIRQRNFFHDSTLFFAKDFNAAVMNIASLLRQTCSFALRVTHQQIFPHKALI